MVLLHLILFPDKQSCFTNLKFCLFFQFVLTHLVEQKLRSWINVIINEEFWSSN